MKKAMILTSALCLAALCACGVTDQSQTSSVSTEPTGEPMRVEPMPSEIDLNALRDDTLAVSFDASCIKTEENQTTIDLTVYSEELFDAVEISQMDVGDTIVVKGEPIEITSKEEDGDNLVINGGEEEGGATLTSADGGTYRYVGMDDISAYDEVGSVTLPVDETCILTDDSNPEHPGKEFSVAELSGLNDSDFTPYNTTVQLTGGKITAIHRSYMP